MDNGTSGQDVANALAQSRSVQGLVRVLNLFGTKYSGTCCFKFDRHNAEGVEINFGTSDKGAARDGLPDMIRMLALTDELMMLEAMISNLRDRGAESRLIDELVSEAHGLIAQLYPDLKIAHGPDSNA